MDWLFVCITAVVAFLALGNWRAALYVCIVLDVVRDPFRKLTEQQLSITTVIVGIVWLGALLGALNVDQRELRKLLRRYPQIRSSLIALAIALLPGIAVSTIRYNNGWILAAIGTASYSAPFVGVVLGYLWPRRVGDVYRWMSVYALINAVFLVGSILEYNQIEVAGLGGLKMKWIRNYGHDFITLICGFYRSPDVMGLHAAHVIMFAVLLAIRPRQRFVWFWLAIGGWASISLLLCGRRKMIAIPLVCLATFITLVAIYTGRKKTAAVTAVFVGLCVGGLYIASDGIVAENEYTRFAGSIATEGMERASRSFTEIVYTTVNQSGWLGDGLGTVTQGRQYLGVVTHGKDWQEDGVGRLFKELGIPGVVSIVLALALLVKAAQCSLDAIPIGHPVGKLQYGFCGVIAANVASFSVSHQAYSGDPSTVLIVGFCMGIVLGLPRPVWLGRQEIAQQIPDPRISHNSNADVSQIILENAH